MPEKGNISKNMIMLLFLIILLMFSGCERSLRVSPPDNALSVLNNVREGYNREDADKFCKDFSDIMFTNGFTKKAYLDVVESLKKKFGDWEQEVYLGEDKGVYRWQVKFSKGKSKLVLVLNNDSRVTGLWFR